MPLPAKAMLWHRRFFASEHQEHLPKTATEHHLVHGNMGLQLGHSGCRHLFDFAQLISTLAHITSIPPWHRL